MKLTSCLVPRARVIGFLAVLPILVIGGRAEALVFTPGDLVISVYGNGDGSGALTDNQAAPIVLQQITTSGVKAGSMVLPQTSRVVNGVTQSAVSGEYGSSSEGLLQRSGDGKSLVIAGYGVNAATYNAGGAAVYGDARLAQSTSVQGGSSTAVSRVIASIRADGSTDTSTALYNIDNKNNPRSVATVDGTTFYMSGQGATSTDPSGGVYMATKGSSVAVAIDTSTQTRAVEIVNGKLYVSRDNDTPTTTGISSYGSTLPTGATAPTALAGIGPDIASLTAVQGNSANTSRLGNNVYLSPQQFFFANDTTLYVADTGNPKNGNTNRAQLGDGGLQKWVLVNGVWTLEYNISSGLNLVKNAVNNSTKVTTGTTGLIGLTGKVVGDSVFLYATNSTLGDLDQTYVYSLTDSLSALAPQSGETFSTIYTAAAGTNVRGIAFAPEDISVNLPEPATLVLLGGGIVLVGMMRRRGVPV